MTDMDDAIRDKAYKYAKDSGYHGDTGNLLGIAYLAGYAACNDMHKAITKQSQLHYMTQPPSLRGPPEFCPFCAATNDKLRVQSDPKEDGYFVECAQCGCRGPIQSSPMWAIMCWNNRSKIYDQTTT